MANKRSLKKQIRYICGDVAVEAILTREFVEGIDPEKLNAIVIKIADLQEKSLRNASFSFDKAPRDFASLREYHKAARAYYHEAYKVFYKEFNAELQKIITEFNAAIPAQQRELNKQLANA